MHCNASLLHPVRFLSDCVFLSCFVVQREPRVIELGEVKILSHNWSYKMTMVRACVRHACALLVLHLMRGDKR